MTTPREPGHGHVHQLGTEPFDWARDWGRAALAALEGEREPVEWPPELHDAGAERDAAWCDRCGGYHDWRRPCEE